MLDFGAIGKGYAIERAANLLREAGITSALLHGGTSTVYALGTPPDEEAWNVAVENPPTVPDQFPTLLAVVPLQNEALSISAVWGKSFQAGRKTYGHVLDPRTGQPTSHALLSAVVAPSATESDALSTALLTVGAKGHAAISALRPQMRTILMEPTKGKIPFRIRSHGIDIRNTTSSTAKTAPHVQNRVKSPLKKQP